MVNKLIAGKNKTVRVSRFEFHLWGREPHFVPVSQNSQLPPWKMMVLNLQRITENDNMILLQNEDWFLSWGYLKGKLHHYKTKIVFYHQVTWREQQLPFLQNDIRFLHVVLWWANSFATKWLSILKFFQLPKRWKLIKCNSQPLATKCLAQPHFGILI